MHQSSKSRRTFAVLTHLAIIIAIAVAAVPPVLSFVFEYRHEQAVVTIEAEINGRIIEELINANPEMWVFEDSRLEELLNRRSNASKRSEIRTVFDSNNKLVAQSRDELQPPLIAGQSPLFDSGRQVGYIQIDRSLRPVLSRTLWVLLASCFFGAVIFMVIRNLPLHALRQAFNALAEEKEKAQVTLQSIGDAVITTDAQMCIEYLNPIAEQLTGWTTAQACGQHVDEVFKIYDEQSRLPAVNPIRECLKKDDIAKMENHTILVRHTDDAEFYIEDSAAPIRRADGSIVGAVMVFHDITDRKTAERRLHHIAFHDSLTGLPNRALFRKKLSTAMISARFMKKHVAVLFLDLDRFKIVNDSLGHAIGDELLILVAKRLEQCVRDSDVICRMGGDEFTAVLSSINVPDNAGAVAEKIIESIAKPFIIQGHELRISTSIGIALYPENGENLDDILKNADAAMYHAKDQGRSNYQYFNAGISAKGAHNLQLENALLAALEKNEFFLEYQPKLNLANHRIIGCEALLRWQSSDFGRVMPNDFIPRLEETGAIIAVGAWVIETAISQAKHWLDQGHPMTVSVNMSVRQFRQFGLVEQIAAMLKTAHLPPALLQLEITESLLMEDAERSEAIMRHLIAIGVNVSLDDFGTGYSSLSYLRRFPISELKIDRSFVVDMSTDETASRIVKTVIDLGQALGMKVTAEGVETEEQRSALQSLGCDEIQGYLLSRPLQPDAFDVLINTLQSPSQVYDGDPMKHMAAKGSECLH